MGDSSNPSDGGGMDAGPGSLGQPCRADDTCDAGLRCQIISSSQTVCVPAGDAGTDATVNDSGGSDASDGGVEAGCNASTPLVVCTGGTYPCMAVPDSGSAKLSCDTQASCKSNGFFYGECAQASDCPTMGQVCCFTLATFQRTGTCMTTVTTSATSPFTSCQTSCGMANYQLCTSYKDCKSGNCDTGDLVLNTNQQLTMGFGICE